MRRMKKRPPDGDPLREAMRRVAKDNGLSGPYALANAAGLGEGTIKQFFTGGTQYPSRSTLIAINERFRVNLEDMAASIAREAAVAAGQAPPPDDAASVEDRLSTIERKQDEILAALASLGARVAGSGA